MDAEVIVVGAGPGGASAAYHLARRGRRVLLLDRQRFPRDKSCGDGLTRSCVRLLDELGVLEQLEGAHRNRGARVFMQGKGSRDFPYPGDLQPDHGLVVPRYVLDNIICQQAVAAGAVLRERTLASRLIYEDGVVSGVEVTADGAATRLRAPVVVAADGAASRLAAQAGLVQPGGQGYAMRGYYDGVDGLGDLLELYMPLLDPTDRYLLPSYGWVFPTGPDSANIGVGLFERRPGLNLRTLFERFLDSLRVRHRRLDRARLRGTWLGAPLRFDFAANRAFAPGLLLVGDAAGLISPFTGEGISYAIESGKLAAEAVDRNLRSQETPDLSDYGILLEKAYTGYFETGRHAAQRYRLMWHVLESTFHNERPLFDLCRRAILVPEAGEPYASKVLDDVSPLIATHTLDVREDLLAVGETLAEAVRRDWPFLARTATTGPGDPGIPFRPSLLLLLCGYLAGQRNPLLIRMSAAIELGYLAALAHLSVEEESPETPDLDGVRPANWGNMLALIAGDFLLSKAHLLSASSGFAISKLIADSLARVCEGRLRELDQSFNPGLSEEDHLEIVARKTATLFELPCRIGATAGGASPAAIAAVTSYGHFLGLAFQIAEDVYVFRGKPSRLSQATRTDLRSGVYTLSVVKGLRQSSVGTRLSWLLSQPSVGEEDIQESIALIESCGAANEALQVAHGYATQARAALSDLPEGPVRASLDSLADYVVTRQLSKPVGAS